MMKKLVWPATLLASFALAAACGGGTTGDGEGGQGGTDGSTGGNGTGGKGTGGSAEGGGGGQGGLGGGTNVIRPETCSDDLENEDETDVDCGGPDCDPCEADATCEVDADCASTICTDGACVEAVCGDSVVNGDEDCDVGRETDECDADCTFAECGDGYFNSRVEECEPDPDFDIWQRCSPTCVYGVDLDGTWRTDNVIGTGSPWESLAPNATTTSGPYGIYIYPYNLSALPGFQYAGTEVIHDFWALKAYDIADDAWIPINAPPFSAGGYESGAVDSESYWVPRGGTMFRFDLASATWTDLGLTGLPDGAVVHSTAVFDGNGFIWYASGSDTLVKFDPSDGSFEHVSYAADYAGFLVADAHMAYDPVSNRILTAGYNADRFLILDLASETFSNSATSPYGTLRDNTCQDRAGGVYTGSSVNSQLMYRYDVANDEFTELPLLPLAHDDYSMCMVSEVGYLYFATSSYPGAFARLRLNHR
jgi:hypothetical protein